MTNPEKPIEIPKNWRLLEPHEQVHPGDKYLIRTRQGKAANCWEWELATRYYFPRMGIESKKIYIRARDPKRQLTRGERMRLRGWVTRWERGKKILETLPKENE